MRPLRSAARLSLVFGFAALLVSSRAETSESAAKSGDRPPNPVYREAPLYPSSLFNTGVRGEANIVCLIDDHGRVTEAVVRDTTRPEFGATAVEAARLWRFEPAMRGGQNVSSRVCIPFVFNDGVEERIESVVRRKIYVDVEGPVVPAESLATWPRPVARAWPRYPQTLKGTGAKGLVMVSFVIDHNGLVVNPTVIKTAREEFVVPALASAASLKFSPVLDPTGDPVNVNMIVEFSFDEKMLKEEEKDKLKRIVIRRPMRDEGPDLPSR